MAAAAFVVVVVVLVDEVDEPSCLARLGAGAALVVPELVCLEVVVVLVEDEVEEPTWAGAVLYITLWLFCELNSGELVDEMDPVLDSERTC